MSTVPFLDLGRLHASIKPEIDAAIASVIESSGFVGGRGVAAFEADFAAAHGAPGAVGCGSGTDALSLVLRAMGIGNGDEVIVPSMTFVATAEAVVHVGAVPVVADVDAETLLLDADSVDAVRTPRTRAVIPVHLYGHVVPFDLLRHWRDDGLAVVEDAAQAHVARWKDDVVGSVGHAACFSFYPGKNLGALGDGGAVVSSDAALLDEVRRLRDHGRRSKYVHDVVGWCSRLDGLQAAVLAAKLRHLEAWTEGRVAAADRYRDALGDRVVPWEDGAVHHLLVMRSPDRDRLTASLDEASVGWGVHYPVPLSRQPWLAGRATPNAEEAAERIVSLPMDPLLSEDDVDRVVAAVLESGTA